MRRLRLLPVAYQIAFLLEYIKNYRENAAVRRGNPDLTFPPERLLYATQPTTSYRVYLTGKEAAERYLKIASEHIERPVQSVYEWGCGTATVVRHVPLIDPTIDAHGSDYDERLIAWCRENVPNVSFRVNALEPPLPYDVDSFDFVYARSVFTHLPHDLQRAWLHELVRVARPASPVLLTVLGDAHTYRLTSRERKLYERTGLVEHGGTARGSPWYTTYNSPRYMADVFLAGFDVVYKKTWPQEAFGKTQDIWVVRKPAAAS